MLIELESFVYLVLPYTLNVRTRHGDLGFRCQALVTGKDVLSTVSVDEHTYFAIP